MNLVINSQFRPFTFDEMLKPLVLYKEAYDAAEKEYSNLASLTEEWRDAAMKESNPIAYDKFNRYSNDLEAAVNDFSRGMNINNRRALLGLKRRYHKEIEPIAKASKKIDELAAEQRKMSASNPNLMFSRDFSSDVSIDQMMENPNLSYKAVDGNDLYKKGASISQAMSSRVRTLSPDMKNQYWKIVEGYGEEVANQFLLDSGAIPELNKALEDLVSSSGATDNIKDRAFEYAKQGAIAGMTSKTTYQNNLGYVTPAQAHSMRMQEAQLALSAARGSGRGSRGGSSSGTERANRLESTIKVRATNKGGGSGDYEVGATWDLGGIPDGATNKSYGELTPEQKGVVDRVIGTDSREGYEYYIITEDANGVGTGDDDLVIIRPKKTIINGSEEIDENAL